MDFIVIMILVYFYIVWVGRTTETMYVSICEKRYRVGLGIEARIGFGFGMVTAWASKRVSIIRFRHRDGLGIEARIGFGFGIVTAWVLKRISVW
jgi:CRISPR/Cas system endoribonuclease Cas6 (RAMP superfamily)